MKAPFTILLKDGKLTLLSILLAGLIGGGTILLALIYANTYWQMVLAFIFGGLLVGLGAFSAKAQMLGLKPFSSDPIGWRKAKDSYKVDNQNEQVKVNKP